MPKILIADPLHPAGRRMFEESGAEVHAMTAEEKPRLLELVADVDALVVRSSTKVTREVLEAGKRLRVVGRAGIGVDNVDVAAATERGVLVVNAPTANLISATEHTFALLLALARRVPAADRALKEGIWDRKSFVGYELQQKVLGVIGFGRIGQRVARRAQAFDMKVLAFDPYLDEAVARRLDVEPVDLDGLLERADVVTLHVPLTDETRSLLDRTRLGRMRAGSLLVNCGRGGVVDEEALLELLESGHLAGAGLDVFAQEPLTSFELVKHPRVVATPHIGAQTREAQERIGAETARMVLEALRGSLAVSAVNLPFRTSGSRGGPWLHLAEQLGQLASALAPGVASRLEIGLWGLPDELGAPVQVAALKGALTPHLGESVNYVNAEGVAANRGIDVVRTTRTDAGDYPHLVQVTIEGADGRLEVAGTVFGEREARVVRFQDFHLEFRPQGRLLVLRNTDVPGVVGRLGTILGSDGVNIAEIHLSRRRGLRGIAVAILRLDQEPSEAARQELLGLEEVLSVQFLDLSGG